MALDYIQPAVQVRRVAKLLELVAIRVKCGEVPESLESSLEIELSALEISPPSVITVSRGDCFATSETDCSEDFYITGDALERATTRGDREDPGASHSANAGQRSEASDTRQIQTPEQDGGER